MSNDSWFEQLAAATRDVPTERAPARLKSRVYSRLVSRMAQSAPLRDLRETKLAGGHLCVFEHTLTLVPSSTGIGTKNPCRICHARALAERLTRAPIFWPGCPYSEFHNG